MDDALALALMAWLLDLQCGLSFPPSDLNSNRATFGLVGVGFDDAGVGCSVEGLELLGQGNETIDGVLL